MSISGILLVSVEVAFDANLQYKFAVEKYLKAISIDPKHLDARLNLSILYTDMGEFQKACNQLEKILEIEPDNKIARETLNSIKKE